MLSSHLPLCLFGMWILSPTKSKKNEPPGSGCSNKAVMNQSVLGGLSGRAQQPLGLCPNVLSDQICRTTTHLPGSSQPQVFIIIIHSSILYLCKHFVLFWDSLLVFLELTAVLLPLFPKYWNYRCAFQCTVIKTIFKLFADSEKNVAESTELHVPLLHPSVHSLCPHQRRTFIPVVNL